jgi:hypothetical protein
LLRRLLTLKLASVPPEGEPVRRETMEEECTDAECALARRLAEYPARSGSASSASLGGW